MPQISAHRLGRFSFVLILAALTLPTSGCLVAAVTAGVVGAGAAGYTYYQAAVPRDFPAGMDQTWAAAQQAVTDLGMPLVSAVRDNDSATIESRTGDGNKVTICLEPRSARVPADGQWTHVTVRVALIGDSQVSERILNQIDAPVAPPAQPGSQVPVTVGPPANQTGPPPSQTGPPPLASHKN